MSDERPPTRTDIFADLLSNLGKLMLALLVVIIFGSILVAALWAFFGWYGIVGLAVVPWLLWQLAGRASRQQRT